ncbi:hypothetical protein J2T60_000564 [Natronospira proteinivora]|uniref:YdhG-like domain-containing protein n=1 Tax=Natronospira proteinivora TaxID=1807133 RepID=A0ABT1G5M3_9GAMM|nr:DUF1801 domain-containing protein [Natronospira proteinivora]MCP1726599.1 hypothetical protein [Natronospira proteinivora]
MTKGKADRLLDDIRQLSEARHAMTQAVREVALSVGPDVSEEVKYGGLLFSARDFAFCGVFAYTHHVSVEFSEGASLPDPHQVLEGQGKYRRHIKLRSKADITEKYLQAYIKAAYEAIESPE